MKLVALGEAGIRAGLATLSGWQHQDGVIRRVYSTDGWRASVLAANAIAFICEAADHHADILLTWPSVTVSLSTHDAGGITTRDLEVAALIDQHLQWKPPAGSTLTGPAKPLVS